MKKEKLSLVQFVQKAEVLDAASQLKIKGGSDGVPIIDLIEISGYQPATHP